ncbi:MAG TPA: SUF system NifU family Fe-S cluster assembly protein [Fimbriimonadaceae bacterium]|jgi:nitrogen fixation NifU-like protein
MNEIRELYQEVILDHNRRPRNFGPLPEATSQAEGYNPLCGDKVSVFVSLQGDFIKDIHFTGSGCAISQASASLMTEAVKGKSIAEAKEILESFHQMVTDEKCANCKAEELEVLAGVKEYPIRIKCATLAWHTLASALEKGAHA